MDSLRFFIPALMLLCQNETSVPQDTDRDWGTIAVKVAISFIAGIVVTGLILIGIRTVLPTQAETTTDNTTGNITQAFLNMLPDIEKIYRESLLLPFQKAESKIYDEEIAEFYRELMDATGLGANP